MNKILQKEFINKTKLIFSSLFARNMQIVIMGCPDLPDTSFLTSNIPLDEMEIYEPTADYYIHRVDIKDLEYYSILITKFPALKENVIFMNSSKFLAAFNKCVKDLDICVMKVKGDELVLECDGEEFVVGNVISEFMAGLYHSLLKQGMVHTEEKECFIKQLHEEDFNIDKPTFMDVLDHNPGYVGGEVKQLKVIVNAGKNTVSIKEFVKKANLLDFSVTLKVGMENKAIKIQCDVDTPLVKVISVQPAIRYYQLK